MNAISPVLRSFVTSRIINDANPREVTACLNLIFLFGHGWLGEVSDASWKARAADAKNRSVNQYSQGAVECILASKEAPSNRNAEADGP